MDAKPERQLTLGECLAMLRYYQRAHPMTPEELLVCIAELDAMEVCTTCGYPCAYHDTIVASKSCAHFTREL